MRMRLSRFLRKLADFLDPKINPSPNPITVRIKVDTSQAVLAFEQLRTEFREAFGFDFPILK